MKKIIVVNACVFFLLMIAGFCQALDSSSEVKTKTCTIQSIQGPVTVTSCGSFTFQEQTLITDITGRELFVWQIPLPCDAQIEYKCTPEGKCSIIQTLIIQKEIRQQPE